MITRDRVTYAKRCLSGLLLAGLDVHIVDHGSTYEPMLNWLGGVAGQVDDDPPQRIHVHWKPDAHPRDIWANGTVASIVHPSQRYIVTDCDVVTPDNLAWLGTLHLLLDARPDVVKAGCGLVTEDLPDHYEHAERVRTWESNYQSAARLRTALIVRTVPGAGEIVRVPYFEASVDTTLAMYPPLATVPDGSAIDPAVRTAAADLRARHLPWYEDSANESDELRYYREHAVPGISMWLDPDGHVDHRPGRMPTTLTTEVVDS
jgi:hypothetical protein